jgi:hypothetical protein
MIIYDVFGIGTAVFFGYNNVSAASNYGDNWPPTN